MRRNKNILLGYCGFFITGLLLCILFLTSCATQVPEGELFYKGQKSTKFLNVPEAKGVKENAYAVSDAKSEVNAALNKAHNQAFLGQPTLTFPWSIGLGIHNAFRNSKKGLGKWIGTHFGAEPILISSVNPSIRTKIATNILHDFGMFNGKVTHSILINPKDSTRAKVRYSVDMGTLYHIDSLYYYKFPKRIDKILDKRASKSLIEKNDPFNVSRLDEERIRMSNLLRNKGYYYFQPQFFKFQADTTITSQKVRLRAVLVKGIKKHALKPYKIGNISVSMSEANDKTYSDSLEYKGISIRYAQKQKVRSNILSSRLLFRKGDLYHLRDVSFSQQRLMELGAFRYADFRFTPRDSLSNILDLNIRAVYDKPYDVEFAVNAATKSNGQIGPGLSASLSKNNIFGGGERFTIGLKGSYEWQTHGRVQGNNIINSYEIGINTSLSVPGIVTPWKHYDIGSNTLAQETKNKRKALRKITNASATSSVKLYANGLNRSGFYGMISFGGEVNYQYRPNKLFLHNITPLKFIYNTLRNTTEEFDQIMQKNPGLLLSMRSQYIPSLSYSITYDNASKKRIRNTWWWNLSFSEAGNVASLLSLIGGSKFNDEKKLLGTPYAQFVKFTAELRRTWSISPDRKHKIATRIGAGIIKAYGNSINGIPPYSEQFYVGGANSIRAFTVRSVGPGNYIPDEANPFGYIDQTGDLKFEANIEYRFPLVRNFYGAIFLDSGNVWTLSEDSERPGSKFQLKNFFDQLALGTGLGIRYDLGMFIIRFDCGVAIHTPYDTKKSGYYNIPSFKDGIGLHFAIGYPF